MSGPKPQSRFIVFEGGEGTGKSTQAALLAQALMARGIDTELTREPGGTPGAETIRALLLDPPGDDADAGGGWTVEAEALLFAAARADHVAKRIRPALAAGRWVICDRFLDSSRAYQGAAGGLGDEALLALHQIGSGGLEADMTLVLEAGADNVAKRLQQRDGGKSDAIGGRSAHYHAQVGAAFRDFAKAGGGRYALVNADAAPEDVHAQIMAALAPLLDDAGRAL